jgi:tetratricopeptide (TPR) repeat protein
MNKKLYISIFSLLLAVLVLAVPVKAQPEAELPSPGLTPDSAFYFLEGFFEEVGTFFTFGDVAKAERYAKLAAERIAEAKAVVDKGKPEAAEKALIRYRDQLEKSLAKADQARAKGKSISRVTEIVSQATAKHLTVLEEVLERVPEQAKLAILRAREVSKTGQIKALEKLAKEKPERAANLNIQTIRDRLKKIKKEAREGNEENAKRTLADFVAFRASLEKMGKENKMALAGLVSEDMTGQVEDLDEVESEAGNISSQMAERVKAIKASTINGQIDVLRGLARVNPEKAAEIFSQATEKRLNKAKREAEGENAEEAEESVKEFEKYASFGQEISEIAQGLGKDTTTVEQLVARAAAHHLEVLNGIYNKVPEQAKEAIQKAMTVSEAGRQRAVEALKRKGALENIPETVPVPKEVKEKVIKVIEERKIPKPEILRREKTKKPEVEAPEKLEVEKPSVENVEEVEKPRVEKPEIPKTSPNLPARPPRP